MNVEQTLIDEFRVLADGTEVPPPPDAADLVRTAERDRRRSSTVRLGGTALVAAAVVAAIVLGSQVGKPDAAPRPAHPSPSFDAPGVPYLYKQRLYVDHEPRPGSWFEVRSAGRFTVALGTDGTAVILRDGELVQRIPGRLLVVRLSRDGSKAAWIEKTGSRSGMLVVRDVVRSREIGRLPLDMTPRKHGGLEFSLTVTDAGVAFYDINGVEWRWRPRHGAPTRTDREPNDWTSYADPADFDVDVHTSIRWSPDHLWGAWLTDRHGQVVEPGQHDSPVQDGITVQKPNDPGSRFTIALPDGADGSFVSWDSPTVIWVQVRDGGDMFACDITTKECHVAKRDLSP
ncbi:MAG TPA: hypothetical protein VFE07_09785 [Marmoricola sp.]|nr:hypothetical protein [Marmoricola sp.]